MTDAIVYPKYHTSMETTEIFKAPLIAKAHKHFEREFTRKAREFEKRELRLRKSQNALASAREAMKVEAAQAIERERRSLVKQKEKEHSSSLQTI